MENSTVTVTFLPDLGHPEHHVPGPEDTPHRKALEINALHQQIFSEIPIDDAAAFGIELLHLVVGQKTYLAVPFAGVGVIFNPVILQKMAGLHRPLLRSLGRAHAHGPDDSLQAFLFAHGFPP